MLMLEEQMTDKKTTPPTKGKRSVALSGVTAGSTALSTVGTDGKSLHYRGYNILDLAPECAFEEVAYLLIHGKLPTESELKQYTENYAPDAICRCLFDRPCVHCLLPLTPWMYCALQSLSWVVYYLSTTVSRHPMP